MDERPGGEQILFLVTGEGRVLGGGREGYNICAENFQGGYVF